MVSRCLLLLRYSSRNVHQAVLSQNARRLSTTKDLTPKPRPPIFDEETDVLIVGSGAGALTASLRATALGLRNIVIEKEETIGRRTMDPLQPCIQGGWYRRLGAGCSEILRASRR